MLENMEIVNNLMCSASETFGEATKAGESEDYPEKLMHTKRRDTLRWKAWRGSAKSENACNRA